MTSFKSKGFKTMNCQECKNLVEKVDSNATAVTCWKCVNNSLKGTKYNCENEFNGKDTEHSTTSK